MIPNPNPNEVSYEELVPMLLFPYWNLKLAEQTAIWKDSNDWIAQQKLNGCRTILHFVNGVGVFAHSRTVSKTTGRRQEFRDHLLFSDFVPKFTATVDCEAIVDKSVDTRPYTSKGEVTRSSLQSTTAVLHLEAEASKALQRDQDAPLVFHVFDMVRWQELDLKKKPLCERLSYLVDFRAAIDSVQLGKYFEYPQVRFQGKEDFFHEVTSRGGEGVVLKNLNSVYEDSSARNRKGWIKVKHQLECQAFVSGFERGKTKGEWKNKVGVLIFSVLTEKGEQVIAKITNLPFPFRKQISVYDPVVNKVELNPDVYGKVATVGGVEISQRAYRLSHPKLIRWRSDVLKEQCRYSAADIECAGWGSKGNPLLLSEGNDAKKDGV
jgi:ATP-dependent DNA ligase